VGHDYRHHVLVNSYHRYHDPSGARYHSHRYRKPSVAQAIDHTRALSIYKISQNPQPRRRTALLTDATARRLLRHSISTITLSGHSQAIPCARCALHLCLLRSHLSYSRLQRQNTTVAQLSPETRSHTPLLSCHGTPRSSNEEFGARQLAMEVTQICRVPHLCASTNVRWCFSPMTVSSARGPSRRA
jgi:hypothetical protein